MQNDEIARVSAISLLNMLQHRVDCTELPNLSSYRVSSGQLNKQGVHTPPDLRDQRQAFYADARAIGLDKRKFPQADLEKHHLRCAPRQRPNLIADCHDGEFLTFSCSWCLQSACGIILKLGAR